MRTIYAPRPSPHLEDGLGFGRSWLWAGWHRAGVPSREPAPLTVLSDGCRNHEAVGRAAWLSRVDLTASPARHILLMKANSDSSVARLVILWLIFVNSHCRVQNVFTCMYVWSEWSDWGWSLRHKEATRSFKYLWLQVARMSCETWDW